MDQELSMGKKLTSVVVSAALVVGLNPISGLVPSERAYAAQSVISAQDDAVQDWTKVAKLPLVDKGQDGKLAQDVAPTDYTVTPVATGDGVYEISVSASEVPAHYNDSTALAYWVGVGVPYVKGYKYFYEDIDTSAANGWDAVPEKEFTPDEEGTFTGYTDDNGSQFARLYQNIGYGTEKTIESRNAALDKWAFKILVKNQDVVVATYKVTFNDVTVAGTKFLADVAKLNEASESASAYEALLDAAKASKPTRADDLAVTEIANADTAYQTRLAKYNALPAVKTFVEKVQALVTATSAEVTDDNVANLIEPLTAAQAAYAADALKTDAGKALVDNATLNDEKTVAITKLTEIQGKYDTAAATKIATLMNGVAADTAVASNEDDVLAAANLLGAMSSEKQGEVTAPVAATKTALETAKGQAATVSEQIEDLPAVDVLDLESNKADVTAAKTAYDALTAAAKSYVSSDDKSALDVAVARIAALEVASAKEALLALPAADAAATTITSKNFANWVEPITTAKAEYDALDATQQATITADDAVNGRLAAAQTAYDTAALTGFALLVEAIGNPTDYSEEVVASIEEARAAYELISASDKSTTLATPLATLANLETGAANAAIAAVKALITALPKTVATTDETAINKAREAYDDLPTTSQSSVDNYTALQAAESALLALYVDPFKTAVAAIPSTVTLAAGTQIAAATEALDAVNEVVAKSSALETLLDSDNAFATAKATYDTALETYNELQSEARVNNAIALIDAIGSVSVDSGDDIEAARAAYDALTDEEQEEVTNSSKLEKAEEDYVQALALRDAALNGGTTGGSGTPATDPTTDPATDPTTDPGTTEPGTTDPGTTTPGTTDPGTTTPGTTTPGATDPGTTTPGTTTPGATDSGTTADQPKAGDTVSGVAAGTGVTETVKVTGGSSVTATKVTVKDGGSANINTVTVGGTTYKVTEVAANALKGSKAKTVTVGNNVTKIGKGALQNTTKLTKLTLGKNVKTIGANVLKGSKVKTVTVKSSKLTKKSLKNLVKGSKVKTVKLSGVSKAAKKTYKKVLKAYGVKVK